MEKDAELNGGPANKHILLVDDDEVYRETVATVLRTAGYRITSAPDHRLALQILESSGDQLDLLVLDIVMPDRVNGLALGRMARLRHPGLKIVYISGYDIPGVQREALGPIIRKPVNNEYLLETIAAVLAGSE